MGDTWHGGKGSKYRSVDVKKWNENFSNINFSCNKKKNPKGRYLLLDDIREPNHCDLHDERGRLIDVSGIPTGSWDVVRTYEDFVQYIDTHGIPDVISFDNDLSEAMMSKYCDAVTDNNLIEVVNCGEKQGIHCAEYVVKKCRELGVDIPKYYIHSANHFARPIIRKILSGA